MEEVAIDQLITQLREQFGVTEAIEEQTVAAHQRHFRSGNLRAINSRNILGYLGDLRSHNVQYVESIVLFNTTSLRNYTVGRDIAFLIALGTREGGNAIFRTDSTEVVSAGRDTHRQGVSGMDYLFRQSRHFRDAHLPIHSVNSTELVAGRQNRAPARIQARHILFAHMIKAATDEQAFRRNVRLILHDLHIDLNSEQLIAQLNIDARRTWIALFFAGPGYGRRELRALLQEQGRSGATYDLNGVLTSPNLALHFHVVIARATALRAKVMDLLLQGTHI